MQATNTSNTQEQIQQATELVTRAYNGHNLLSNIQDRQVDETVSLITISAVADAAFQVWQTVIEDQRLGLASEQDAIDANPRRDPWAEDVANSIANGSLSWLPQLFDHNAHSGTVARVYAAHAHDAATLLLQELHGEYSLNGDTPTPDPTMVEWVATTRQRMRVQVAIIDNTSSKAAC